MKQIFDWLREQMQESSYEEEDYFSTSYTVIDLEDAIDKINEAEAKWEADCCEWKAHRYLNVHKTSCGMAIGDYHKAWNFCPYCGKRIKISEVE